MKDAILSIKKKALPLFREAGVRRSALFGSFAKGEERKSSDLDFLVEFPKDKSLLDFIHLKLRLEEVFGKRIDLIDYSVIKPLIKDEILGSQIQIL